MEHEPDSRGENLPQSIAVDGRAQKAINESLVELQREAEQLAWAEEIKERRRRIVIDTTRIFRRARQIQAELAPSRLSASALADWRQWYSMELVPGRQMKIGIAAERRLAPDAL